MEYCCDDVPVAVVKLFVEGVAQLEAPAPPRLSEANASRPLLGAADCCCGDDIGAALPKSDRMSFAFLRPVVALVVLGAGGALKSRSNSPLAVLCAGSAAALTA